MKIRKLSWTYVSIIIGFITAETVTYMGDKEMANYIGLIIALITVAGTIMANFFQYKKDSNKISEVRVDTSEMKPKVDNIREYTKDLNDCILKEMNPNINMLLAETNGSMKKNLADLADDLSYRKRIAKETAGMFSRDYIVSGIDEVYKENLMLKDMIKEYKEQMLILKQ